MKLKIDPKLGSAAEAALEPYVAKLYTTPGLRIMAIVELKQDDKNSPAPDSEAGLWVKARIASVEVARPEQEDTIREAQRALFLQRTATGTLTEDGQVELAEQTLALTGGMLHAIEAARLTASMKHWGAYIRRVNRTEQLTMTELRHELDTVAQGLTEALDHARDDEVDGEAGI
ncbi:hypothetical protein [Nocardiopsis sp. YSL2]|uniref:hypothetical protein n=1 Tax=Nocardiopsis sp. YSL2 TaxID=2939492 RepID=UPI0026F4460E|nr:hypothetical protein [Nocardiopsis sp. YSL2]